MRKTSLTFIAFSIAGTMAAQSNNVFEKVELDAGPDIKKWTAYLNKHVHLPDSIQQSIPPGSYKAVVQFIVDVHGNLGQFAIKSDPGYGLGERAVSIIRGYKDAWRPGSQCGRLVKSYRQQPIVFTINKPAEN